MMFRPLASVSERTERSDVHGVDHRKRTLGASPKWARSGSRRLERRDIKAEIEDNLLQPQRSHCSNNPQSTVALRELKHSTT